MAGENVAAFRGGNCARVLVVGHPGCDDVWIQLSN
jgi:hypothetical protein